MSVLAHRAMILIMRYAYPATQLFDDIFGVSSNPGSDLIDLVKNSPQKQPEEMPNYDPSNPNDKGGNYPTDNSQNPNNRPEGMPDYTPSGDREDNPYTPPPGMPDYSPSGNDDDGGDPNNDPVLPPPPPELPWDRDLPPDPPVDPLVLDLNGDGIKTVEIDSNRYFDADGDGFATSTAWINSNDGFLVMDRDGDGVINNGSELFGDQMKKILQQDYICGECDFVEEPSGCLV